MINKLSSKILLSLSALLLTANANAEMFDFLLPHYVKVDKVVPMKEDRIAEHTIESCTFVQNKESVSCTDTAVLYPRYVSGLDKDQKAEFYEKHLNTVFFDEANNSCFTFEEEEVCEEVAQNDYIPVVYSYKNVAYSNGEEYIVYSQEPLMFIDTRTKYFD